MQTWFVTGASRGLGAQIAQSALQAGHQVVATARNPDMIRQSFPDVSPANLLTFDLDVTDPVAATAAADAAVKHFGHIDVLVNNAGRGLLGAVEEISDAEARSVFDTNVFGTLNVTRAVLPVMREKRSGAIVMISSVGGLTQGPGWGIYGATKSALEGLSEALSAEVKGLGIDLLIVEPGIFRTDFIDPSSLHHSSRQIDDYAASAGQTRAWVADNNRKQPGDPAKAAAAILTALAAPQHPLRLQLGADCVTRVEGKYRGLLNDLEQWRELSVSTSYDQDSANAVPGYW